MFSSKMPLLSLVSGFEMNAAWCSAFSFDLAPQTVKLGHLGLCLFSVLLIHSLFFFFFFARFHVNNINFYIIYSLHFVMFYLTIRIHLTWATTVS